MSEGQLLRTIKVKWEFEHQLIEAYQDGTQDVLLLTEFPPSNLVRQYLIMGQLVATQHPSSDTSLVTYNLKDRDIEAAVLFHQNEALESLAVGHPQRPSIHAYVKPQLATFAQLFGLSTERPAFLWIHTLRGKDKNEEHVLHISTPVKVLCCALLAGDEQTELRTATYGTRFGKHTCWA
eukprot:Protomagalhaensia_wolfi_Nauph_80__6316@NODE_97_length_3755_cov_33_417653_g74_i0_p2_GENE_NODE_97_length_3755_cov_33_417653_g74_i0NODE_97_length_3755_cov_33_417653_g74_i0_p2_ORF_typecomplete_len179_score30_60Vset_CD47/PF08204_11/0_061_NODE_97_length_3755_cov_33_417653_g74_i027913327